MEQPLIDLSGSQGPIISPTGPVTQYFGLSVEQVTTLVEQIRRADQPAQWNGRQPYLGLASFQEMDTELFFGREKLVSELVQRVKQARFVCVAGPSGSGKSSLVQAGLIHALKQGALAGSAKWLIESLTPRGDPMEQLAQAMSAMALRVGLSSSAGDDIRTKGMRDANILHNLAGLLLRSARDQRALIVVDQCEELFTQTKREDERQAFLNLLTTAAQHDEGRVTVLIVLRADFVSPCSAYPELRRLMSQQFQLVGAMEPEELARAIVLPALEVGVQVEPQLVAQLLVDMKGEPGALPLMQFALRDLFDAEPHKQGDVIELTLKAYLERGGMQEALEQHADAALRNLDEQQEAIAQRIFAALIEPGRSAEDTRRTATFAELIPVGADARTVEAVIQILSQERVRLITTDVSTNGAIRTVTIAHEKLISAWGWLRRLVDKNRTIIALQNQLAEDANRWSIKAREKSYLYSGKRLQDILDQLAEDKITLSELVNEFIQAGLKQQQAKQRFRMIVFIGLLIAPLLVSGGKWLRRELWQQAASKIELRTVPGLDIRFEAFEVTNQRYRLCVDVGGCTPPQRQSATYFDPNLGQLPVTDIDALQAYGFCAWLGRRLPTRQEWLIAATQNGKTPWPWGNTEPDPAYANLDYEDSVGPTPQPAIVGSHAQGHTPEGVYDLIGNVWEWTSSFWEEPGKEAGVWTGLPKDAKQKQLFVMGGSFNATITGLGDQLGVQAPAEYHDSDVGFRCVGN